MSVAIRASGQSRRTGLLFEASPDLGLARDTDGQRLPVRSLWLGINGEEPAATCTIAVGRPFGGGRAERTFTLTPRGCWFQAAGWNNVRLNIDGLSAGAEVSYAWLAEQPPSFWPLLLVEEVAVGTRAIPAGASAVAVGTADAGWTWRTTVAAPLLVAAPQVADGIARPVLGSAYTATVPNVLAWELLPL